MINTKEKLGTTTNLLYGYNESWLTEETGNNALFCVPGLPMKTVDLTPESQRGAWGFPSITLNDSAEELLDELLPYQINDPAGNAATADIPAGPLLIRDHNCEKAIKRLSLTLGIDLGATDCGYVLVKLQRYDGEQTHACNEMGVLIHPNPVRIPEQYGVTYEFAHAVSKLKRIKPQSLEFSPEAVFMDDANGYLKVFTEQGTHFVSRVALGDVIFQVLAMPRERYERVKKIYADQEGMLSGPNAILFRQYTTDANSGAYGYVKEYGNILSFSMSATLKNAIAQQAWVECTFSQGNSIFAPFQEESSINLDEDYRDVTSIQTDLTSLTLILEQSRREIWRRVFKGALIQKFKDRIKPHFVNYCHCDYSSSLNQSQLPGFLSNIATPYINTYRTALDLEELVIVAPEEVKSFILYSNFVKSKGRAVTRIPGDNVLIVGQLFSLESEDTVSTIEVKDRAIDNLSIACQEFFGALLVQNESGNRHFTFSDGLRYESNRQGPSGRDYVAVIEDIRTPPKPDHLAHLKSSIQFNYAFNEGIYHTLPTGGHVDLKSFLRRGLLWITDIIPGDSTDLDLVDIRVRALNLAHLEEDGENGAFVPILPYTQYQQQIDAILDYIVEIDRTIDRYHSDIESRKTQELVIDVAKQLNKNIIESGELLSGYVGASVSQQQALSGYYDSLISKKKSEEKKLAQNISALEAQLNSQRADVDTAVLNYKQSIKDWKITEAISFGLTVATDLFKLGVTVAVPASSISAVKDLGLIVQRIQKLLDILNATNKLFQETRAGLNSLHNAQTTFDGVSDTLSTDLPWDEMSIHLDHILDSGPTDVNVKAKKADLVAAFKILVLRGKALSTARSQQQQNASAIYNSQRQKQLIDDQVERLQQLDTNLNPAQVQDLDRSKIDLIGLTGQLSMVRSQVLGIVANAFTFQDQALQYTFLQPATPIDSFDTLGIKAARVKQQSNKIAAQTALQQLQVTTTSPIDIVVEVPRNELAHGTIYQFHLFPDNPSFFKYVDLRVHSMVARVDGIKSSDSDEYLLNVAYNGQPFMDRALDRDVATFNTIRRERTYEYQVTGNKPRFTDEGESWSDGVNPITPFSIWEISLPKTQTNKNIVFEGMTVKITLSFVLKTRIHDARAQKALLLETLQQEHAALLSAAPVGEANLAITAMEANLPSEQALLSQMSGKSVLNNWDVVFNMALSKINTVLKDQYDNLKNNDKTYGGKISANTTIKGAPLGNIQTYVLQKFNFQYGYPELQFLINEAHTGNLTMKITQGTVQNGSKYVGSDPGDQAFLESLAKQAGLPASAVKHETIGGEKKLTLQYYASEEPLGRSATLHALIKIGQVSGLVNNDHNILSVVLDMAKGAFSPNNIEIEMSDPQKIAFSDAVKAYFVEHPVNFIINSLDLSKITTLPDLRPSGFLFKAFQSQDGNQMLQLFIQTNQRKVFNASQTFISSDVPSPIPQGSQSSLMINSRIFFGSVLPASLNTGWTLQGKDPGDTTTAWTASFSNASVKGTVDLSPLDSSYTPPQGVNTSYTSYSPHGGNPVTWSLDGMTIKPNVDGTLRLAYSKKNTFSYDSSTKICGIFGCSSPTVTTHSTDITLNVSSSMPTTISGSGRQQDIAISVESKDVSIAARTSGGGPCGSDDLQSQVNKKLQAVVPNQITSKLNISFESVSIFALKNLLFPSGNYINLKKVDVPGDLLLLGEFTTDS